MKRRHLLISLGTSAGALAYGFNKQLAVAQLTQNPITLPLPPKNPDVTRCPYGNGLFVLYYGEIVKSPSEEMKDTSLITIMSKQPNFVIFGDGPKEQRKRSDIPKYVHQNGGRAIMYVALGGGSNSTDAVDTKIKDAMNAGYDGIFFDEAGVTSEIHPWNTARADLVKSYEKLRNKTTLVIFNPGINPGINPDTEDSEFHATFKKMFVYADIVCVENRYDQEVPSYPGISPWRWLAVQGDPGCCTTDTNGQLVCDTIENRCDTKNTPPDSAEQAIERIKEFRNNNGFWYYSSDKDRQNWQWPTHTKLPEWYTTFADWVKSQPGDPCPNIVRTK